MVCSTSGGANGSSSTNDLGNNEHELESIADLSEYGDRQVWLTARKMHAEGGELNEATHSAKETDSFGPPEKGGDQGFALEKVHADILLKGRIYFVHFPTVYCYDENRIIFRIGEGPKYHQVTTLIPNPPELQNPFDIGGIAYCFDEHGGLWYKMGEYWLPETIYPELNLALSEVVKCIEANNLHITAHSIYSPLSGDSTQSTSSEAGTQDTSMDALEEGLRALSSNPDQEEIDSWMEDMKRYRAMQVKEGVRLAPIHCPVSTCGKPQRRPQALRDHLYFHFNIEPHKCDYGCPIAFETEANKNRHLETCPIVWGSH
ncbi:hypothetical protein RSAG8_07806, partial [Rhizoctonia solani AG-8 WAC10335]